MARAHERGDRGGHLIPRAFITHWRSRAPWALDEQVEQDLESPWFTGQANIHAFTLSELLGAKLRALYQRKKGRDLFYFGVTLDRLEEDACAEVVRCFLDYLGRSGQQVSRAELEENLAAKRADPSFGADLRPLLGAGVTFDRERSLDEVLKRVVALVPGKPWTPPRGKLAE